MLHFVNQVLSLTRDLVNIADPEQILKGRRMFRPFLKYQKSWLAHFYPDDTIQPEFSAWFYLQKYMIPLIKKHASFYHLNGLSRLKLDTPEEPDFDEFQNLFYVESNGFIIQPVNDEISPNEYFSLILQRKFPCVKKIRSHDELFCANEPDFWHDAIGHIAPLCFKEVQEFYLKIAEYMLSAKTASQFQRHLSVAWTLTEYSFIKEQRQTKMFGAALVGSHLANMRFINGFISVEPAVRELIINSNFYSDYSPLARDDKGNLRFFCMDNLNANQFFLEEQN